MATVCQVNPEFYRHDGEAWSHPSAWWAPSPWMLDSLPDGTRLVPVPVATDRFPMSIPTRHAGCCECYTPSATRPQATATGRCNCSKRCGPSDPKSRCG